MRIFWLGVALAAPLTGAMAQDQKLTKDEEARIFTRVTKNCEIAAAAALPKVPGLEIIGASSKTPELEKSRGAVAVKPYTYSTTVELKVKVLNREERYAAICVHDLDTEARIASIKLQVQ